MRSGRSDQIADLRIWVAVNRLGLEFGKDAMPAKNFAGGAALLDVGLLERL